ncbi:MAG TPA: PIN domain-containing protein [Ktedonobacteraceae bacterium]|nr:PIN domain-containing protein [Ktedonobacteraceae bacterium]
MNLKTPDALHAATAVLNDCALFVTNDSAFSRVGDLTVAILSEVIILNEDSYANEKRE